MLLAQFCFQTFRQIKFLQLVDQDDSSLRSPFPNVGEVPWPSPGSTYLRPDKPPELPSESQVQSHVQRHISMEWEPINTRLNAAHVSGVQHEDTHDWYCTSPARSNFAPGGG